MPPSVCRLLVGFLAFASALGPPAAAQIWVAGRPETARPAAALASGQDVAFTAGLARELLRLPFERAIALADWPLAPGVFAEVTLARREVYAPGARIYRMEREGPVEVPRSRLAFFWGGSPGVGSALWIAVDPATGEISGASEHAGRSYRLRRLPDALDRYVVAPAEAFDPEPLDHGFACSAAEGKKLAGSALFPPPPARPPFAVPALPTLPTLHTAKIAVDTDNELLAGKLGDDTTRAADYIAQLFAALNVMYERDLHLRLLEATTFLRVSSTPDPYSQAAAGNADSAKLAEFATYWKIHYPSVDRALALMLSGKQPATTAASGIGYLNTLCSGSFGYSFNQVFRLPASPAAEDARMVGHEIGHNLGSDHTHCYDPPVDTCYSGEAGRGSCFAGPPSCPAPTTMQGVAGVRGTVMSYCYLSPGGCSASSVFHPRTLDVINPILERHVGLCIFPAGGATDSAGGRFFPVPPCRRIDTRGGPPLAGGGRRTFPLAGACGIPADAKAVAGNLTVVAPEADGFLNAYAADTATPAGATSVINFRAGQIKANNVVLPLPTDGSAQETFANGSGGTANFLLDVNGYFK